MLMEKALMASYWVLCAGPLVIKAIRQPDMHCAHLVARLLDESSRDALRFQLFGNLDPSSKVSMSAANLQDTCNGQTSVGAVAVPQDDMLKTLQWDPAIQGLLCQVPNLKFITVLA